MGARAKITAAAALLALVAACATTGPRGEPPAVTLPPPMHPDASRELTKTPEEFTAGCRRDMERARAAAARAPTRSSVTAASPRSRPSSSA